MGFTWQDPCQGEPRHHQHSLCPTLLHFQHTLGAHLRPFLRPTARPVCSTPPHMCEQPARSLCMYTVDKRNKRQGQKLLMVIEWHIHRGALWEIEGWRAITSCLCHLPPPSPLHYSPWQENTPPPGLHHRACQSSSQKWCVVPQWRGAEPRRCHRSRAAFSIWNLQGVKRKIAGCLSHIYWTAGRARARCRVMLWPHSSLQQVNLTCVSCLTELRQFLVSFLFTDLWVHLRLHARNSAVTWPTSPKSVLYS